MNGFDLSRRGLMLTLAAGGATLVGGRQTMAQAVFEENPFQLGVAAGDPCPTAS